MKRKLIALMAAVLFLEAAYLGVMGRNSFPTTDGAVYDVDATSAFAIEQAMQQQNLTDAVSIFKQTNAVREQQGLPPLTWDPELFMAGAIRAGELPILFSHTRPNGKQWYTACNVMYGENLAQGFQNNVDIMVAWINSPTHLQNLLNPQYTRIGVGVVYLYGQKYVAQVFG